MSEDAKLTEYKRCFLAMALLMLAGLGFIAVGISGTKDGPDEFFSAWNGWKGSYHPLYWVAANLGLICWFLPWMIGGMGLTMETGITDRLGGWRSGLLAILWLAGGFFLVVLLIHSPVWFNRLFAAAALSGAAVSAFLLRNRLRPKPSRSL